MAWGLPRGAKASRLQIVRAGFGAFGLSTGGFIAKAKTSVVFVVAMALSVSGCQSARPQRREPNAILQRTSTLYLARGPYERIHVEIDVVEGPSFLKRQSTNWLPFSRRTAESP